MHPAAVTTEQTQLASQQTPGQAVGEQVPAQVKVPVHEPWLTTVQAPVEVLQHLPVQGSGVQVNVPAKNLLGAVQLVTLTLAVQTHALVQHAPSWAQGLGLQLPRQKNWVDEEGGQVVGVAFAVHPPVRLSQQMPVQGLGVQEFVELM